MKDAIKRNFEMARSPYSLLREVAKKSKILNEEFAKYIWKEISKKKHHLMLLKGPIEISSNPRKKSEIKKHEVKDYLR
jgi:esterase/lipase